MRRPLAVKAQRAATVRRMGFGRPTASRRIGAAADALAARGIVAWEAGDAHEALNALNQHPSIGLLFTDVNMPGEMSGIDLARRVNKVRPDIELIITSGATIIADDDLPDHGTFLGSPTQWIGWCRLS